MNSSNTSARDLNVPTLFNLVKGILEVEKGASGPSPFLYKPYLSNYFPANSIDYIPKHCEIQATSKPLKRKLIIK